MTRVLTKGELHHGAEYLGSSRNALSARWDSQIEKFKYMRFKFGYFFIEEYPHPEDVRPDVDSFRPIQLLGEVADRIISQG